MRRFRRTVHAPLIVDSMIDVLSLATITMRGHDHAPRNCICDLGAKVLTDEIETQVDTRRSASSSSGKSRPMVWRHDDGVGPFEVTEAKWTLHGEPSERCNRALAPQRPFDDHGAEILRPLILESRRLTVAAGIDTSVDERAALNGITACRVLGLIARQTIAENIPIDHQSARIVGRHVLLLRQLAQLPGPRRKGRIIQGKHSAVAIETRCGDTNCRPAA